MAINYSHSFTSDIITQTVTIKDGSTVADYIIGIHGFVIATDDEDNTSISRNAIFRGTDPSTKEAGSFVALADLTGVPDGIKAVADEYITDFTLKDQLAKELTDKKTAPVSKTAPW